MERLRSMVAEVQDKLGEKEQEVKHTGDAVIPYLQAELKKRQHQVVGFEQSLQKFAPM